MDDEAREFVRRLFANDDAAPRDVVPTASRLETMIANIARADAAVGKIGHGTIDGELIEDVDGNPLGVGPSTPVTTIPGGYGITQADVDLLGIDPADHPGIFVYNPRKDQQ